MALKRKTLSLSVFLPQLYESKANPFSLSTLPDPSSCYWVSFFFFLFASCWTSNLLCFRSFGVFLGLLLEISLLVFCWLDQEDFGYAHFLCFDFFFCLTSEKPHSTDFLTISLNWKVFRWVIRWAAKICGLISVCLTKLTTLVSNISWKKSRRHENYAVKEGNEVPKTL